MIDNLGGRLGSFDRLEKELSRAGTGRGSTAPSAAALISPVRVRAPPELPPNRP